jgi:hypothetical protein
VILFSGQRFEGERIAVRSDLRTLRDAGFNDRAGSIVINEGRWEFCEHAGYRGAPGYTTTLAPFFDGT